MTESKKGYVLKLWNGKYGNGAKFIVQDVANKKFAEFTPARPNDIAWVNQDITKEDEYKDWEDFQNEPVDDLSTIIM